MKHLLSIATDGYLNRSAKKLLTVAVAGYLVIGNPTPPPTPPDHGGQFVGGGGRPGTYESYDEHSIKEWEFRKRIKRDDDELLTIIKIWTEQNG